MGALAREVVEEAGQRKNPLGGFKPTRARTPAWRLGELSEVNRLVSDKATLEELQRCATRCRGRAGGRERREGGRLHGFHAERVSEGEQRMLDSLKEALEVSA